MNPFLVSYFPPLTFRQRPLLRFAEFLVVCERNLSKNEMKELDRFRSFIDLDNMIRKQLHESLDPCGVLSDVELSEELREYGDSDAFQALSRKKNALKREAKSGFLGKYFRFEWELNVILAALRARKLGRQVEEELSPDDKTDLFVITLLRASHGAEVPLPLEFQDLGKIPTEPMAAKEALDRYRFNKVEELTANSHFSLDKILGYAVKLKILEDLEDLSTDKGKELIYDNICNW